MIEANRYIFNTLKDFIDDHPKFDRTVDYFGEKYIRFIQTNDQEKKWLKELNVITDIRLTSLLKFVIFEFHSEFYFVSVSLNEQNIDSSSLEEYGLLDFDNNSGIFTALIYQLEVGVKEDIDPYKIFNEVFYPIKEDQKEGFEYTKIVNFFESIKIYQMTKDCPFCSFGADNLELKKKDKDIDERLLFRLALLLLVKNNTVRILKFSPETRECFVKLCEEGSAKISYENLLYSFVSFSWKHCFLDVYRCLEKLFLVPYLRTLHKLYEMIKVDEQLFLDICGEQEMIFSIPQLSKIYKEIHSSNSSVNFHDFATSFQNNTQWKPKEENTLKILLNDQEHITSKLSDIRSNNQNAFKFIYNLRNSIVHFRSFQGTMESSYADNEWNIIVSVCLKLVIILYDEHKDYL
jgi:hypothetical protein